MSKNIFRTKSINQFLSETKQDGGMNRVLGTFGLTMLGIGCIVGTGIFVLTGIAAANFSGPALVISFVIAALACGCAALCYSEFAAMIPVAGSAYTYGYVALGEFWAWVIGWDLILEYTLALSAVSIGWSGYFGNILMNLGLALPKEFITAPEEGGLINLPAMAIIWIITLINMKGITQSSLVNDIIVVIKLAVVGLFIALGVSHVDPANWTPFMPYGWSGVFTGASVIFFAYIGFDAVSTAAEEVKNPQKDLPRGIILSLVICTVLYIAVSAIRTCSSRRRPLPLPMLCSSSVIIGVPLPYRSALSAASRRFSWSCASARAVSSSSCPVTACCRASSAISTRRPRRRSAVPC